MHETAIQARWTDFDALGHLTHSVVLVYLDEARDAFLRERVGDFDAWPTVVAHVRADFRREVARGARELRVRTRVSEVGRTSVRFAQELLDAAGDVAVDAEAVLVAFDPRTRTPREIAPEERERLRR